MTWNSSPKDRPWTPPGLSVWIVLQQASRVLHPKPRKSSPTVNCWVNSWLLVADWSVPQKENHGPKPATWYFITLNPFSWGQRGVFYTVFWKDFLVLTGRTIMQDISKGRCSVLAWLCFCRAYFRSLSVTGCLGNLGAEKCKIRKSEFSALRKRLKTRKREKCLASSMICPSDMQAELFWSARA